MTTLIDIAGVSKVFDNGTEALRDVSLSITAGSFTSLLGPSGCGKSTLLRLVASLIAPTAGTVTTTFSGSGSVGYVFQEPTLMPWATVEGNVAMPLELIGLAPEERANRVTQALELVGLGDFRGSYPRELSGGMKMRVSLARALASKPSVLLLDEPFAALDEITRNRLNDDLIRIAADEGLTVLFVTHSVFESVYLSDRIVVMAPRPGRPLADFTPAPPVERTQDWRLSPDYAALCKEVSSALGKVSEDHDG